MGTTMGSASILEVCNTKLVEFLCNVDNKDMVWLQEIKEEALKMFSSDFSVEPELMPKTPSQRNRRRKKRFSSIQDENRPPTRKRLSRRTSRRSSQHSRRLLRSKDKLERLVLVAAENGSIPRGTRSQAVAAPSPPDSPTVLPQKPGNLPSVGKLVPVVEISVSEQRSAEKCLTTRKARLADKKLSSVLSLGCDDESVPKKQAESLPKPAPETSSVVPAEVPELKATRPALSVAKLRIARPASPEDAVPAMTELAGAPSSAGTRPQPETELLLNLPESPRTPTGSHCDRRSVRRSLVRKSSQAHRVSLLHKYSMVPKRISSARRSSRKLAQEPAASSRIICHSYLEKLLDVQVPRKASSEEDLEHATETEQEAPEGTRRTLRPRNAHKIAISTPKAQPESRSQADGDGESKTYQSEEPREPPQSVRRKRSYKQAVSEPGENGDHMDDDEVLTPPRTKTPSPVCPPSKVVRPLRTFLHTVQKNQMLMTPTSAGRTSVMKSFIKRNTPLHVDAKGGFVEKERQRLENLKRKEEAELLRKQKVEEDKRRRLEEVKMKREERLRKVLQARERAEQLEVEKKRRIEQKLAQLEKNEKAKEERLAEEKARKKAAKKLEEAEARRKQEEEARRQKRLQQEEEDRRYQEQLQKKKEEEQERLRKVAEARRIVEQQKQREQQLVLEREQAERERAQRLQKERLQRELEEKRKRELEQRHEQERRKLQEEQEKKAREAATAGAANKFLNVTVDVQSPACNSYEMTPQGPKGGPKINPDNYGMDLNSDDSTDDETQPRKPIPAWANGTQLSQAVIRQYYQPPDIDQLFGTILSPKLEDIFNKSKPRYHKRTSSAVWHSPPLPGSRALMGLSYGLKKP
ncbi:inner centromere protein isoform X2 [Vombatus ursinus]|uniref:inner centromere protein isoform X2 n=1 Tax=Vombatus ursinus TaxID=29139 RepID=UPI000FFD1E7D|nr:inner centromere protein isoform X2 [Vombatus ursinus]